MSKVAPGCVSLTVLVALGVGAQDTALEPAAVERWLARYEEAWETKDADAAAMLFAADALYSASRVGQPR